MQSIQNIPVSQIMAGNNDRKLFDRAKLEELAASISKHGLAQPITVRPRGDIYVVVAGERRFRAMRDVLHLDAVPCLVRDLADEAAAAVMLVENTSRVDLYPIEEADAYRVRMDEFGWSEADVAQAAGVSIERVRRRLSLLSLIGDVQHLVGTGHMPVGHAEAMVELDVNRQTIAVRIFREARNGMPLVMFKGIIGQLLEEQGQDALFSLGDFWCQQVASDQPLPRRGKLAVTHAPTRSDLPPVTWNGQDNTASIIERYIAVLLTAGKVDEAGALGNVYNALVHSNCAAVPARSALVRLAS